MLVKGVWIMLKNSKKNGNTVHYFKASTEEKLNEFIRQASKDRHVISKDIFTCDNGQAGESYEAILVVSCD